MTKKLFFILIFSCFLPRHVFAADCSSYEVNPKISMTSSFGQLTYNHEKTSSEITSLAKSLNISEQGIFASGLSTVNINFDIEVYTVGKPAENSAFCIIPTEIKIFLGLDSPTIYLANGIANNTCKYNVVLHHEQVHQQINQSVLEYYLPLFKQSAAKIASTLKPVYISDINDAQKAIKQITETYNQKLLPLVNYIKKEMLTEQQKLDNQQNYLFESALCK